MAAEEPGRVAEHLARGELGGGDFEPMAGRAMRGYVTLPATIIDDPAALDPWIVRAIAHVRTLTPK